MKPVTLPRGRIKQIVLVLTMGKKLSPDAVKREVEGMFLTKRDRSRVERLYNSVVRPAKKRRTMKPETQHKR